MEEENPEFRCMTSLVSQSLDDGGLDGAGYGDCSGTLLILQQAHFAGLLSDTLSLTRQTHSLGPAILHQVRGTLGPATLIARWRPANDATFVKTAQFRFLINS